MKKLFVILFFCYAGCCYCQRGNEIRKGYNDSLRKVIMLIDKGETPKQGAIEFCIPESEDESAAFYHLDQTPGYKSFGILDKIIREQSVAGHPAILKKYLMLSQFVDGYFAEAYFEFYIDELMSKQHDLFCSSIKAIPAEKKKRLATAIQKARCK